MHQGQESHEEETKQNRGEENRIKMGRQKMESEKEVSDLKKRLKKAGPYKPPKKFWTDKQGKELTYREFMDRWKNGMKGVTQYQQISMQLNSTYIILIGIICGFTITFFNLKNLWWLTIILGGALFNTSVTALGLWQKKVVFKEIEDQFKSIEKEVAKQ